MEVRGIRGAISVEENTSESIINNTKELLTEILTKNEIKKDEIVTVFFTMTNDLDAVFPAVAARQIGLTDVSLLCTNELNIRGALKKCIRILVQINTNKTNQDLKHIYLKEAANLRTDINKGES